MVVFWPYLFGGSRAERAQIVRLEALVVWTDEACMRAPSMLRTTVADSLV